MHYLCLWLSEVQAYESGVVHDRQRLYGVGYLADDEWTGTDCVSLRMTVHAFGNFLRSEVAHLQLIGTGVELHTQLLRVLNNACDILCLNFWECFAEGLRGGLEEETLEAH